MSDGVHRMVATYADGREEVVLCGCDWCEVTREMWPQIEGWLRSVEPEHRPDWLPTGTGEGAPPARADEFADVRRIHTPTGGHYG